MSTTESRLRDTVQAIVRTAQEFRLPRVHKNRPGSAAGIDHEQLAAIESGPGIVTVTVVISVPTGSRFRKSSASTSS